MIIDCHGHYTTEPKDLHRFREDQTAAANAKDTAAMPPRASGMGHHVGDEAVTLCPR